MEASMGTYIALLKSKQIRISMCKGHGKTLTQRINGTDIFMAFRASDIKGSITKGCTRIFLKNLRSLPGRMNPIAFEIHLASKKEFSYYLELEFAAHLSF